MHDLHVTVETGAYLVVNKANLFPRAPLSLQMCGISTEIVNRTGKTLRTLIPHAISMEMVVLHQAQ